MPEQEQLQLTQQQAVSMRAAHDMLHGELRELLGERKALVSRLQVQFSAITDNPLCHFSVHCCSGLMPAAISVSRM